MKNINLNKLFNFKNKVVLITGSEGKIGSKKGRRFLYFPVAILSPRENNQRVWPVSEGVSCDQRKIIKKNAKNPC